MVEIDIQEKKIDHLYASDDLAVETLVTMTHVGIPMGNTKLLNDIWVKYLHI
jgi:hypothetical protein